jgi:hypothetical protein
LLLALEDIEQAAAGNEAADDKKDALAARARGDKCRLNRGALPARGLKLLDHYRGIVQCDGCAAYKTSANAACDEAIIRRVAITQADPKD